MDGPFAQERSMYYTKYPWNIYKICNQEIMLQKFKWVPVHNSTFRFSDKGTSINDIQF